MCSWPIAEVGREFIRNFWGGSAWQTNRGYARLLYPGSPLSYCILSLGTAGLQAADTIFPSTAVPQVLSTGENLPMELGVKFQPAYNGTISGIRFYKGVANTGPHVASLWLYTGSRLPNTQNPGVNQPIWNETGTLLAQAPFTNETASGWQEVDFPTPIPVTAQTVYAFSYFTASGNPSVTGWWLGSPYEPFFINTPYTNAAGDLTALRDGTAGQNGVYDYLGSPGFPTSSWGSPNFWVDVVYTPNPIPESTISGPPRPRRPCWTRETRKPRK